MTLRVLSVTLVLILGSLANAWHNVAECETNMYLTGYVHTQDTEVPGLENFGWVDIIQSSNDPLDYCALGFVFYPSDRVLDHTQNDYTEIAELQFHLSEEVIGIPHTWASDSMLPYDFIWTWDFEDAVEILSNGTRIDTDNNLPCDWLLQSYYAVGRAVLVDPDTQAEQVVWFTRGGVGWDSMDSFEYGSGADPATWCYWQSYPLDAEKVDAGLPSTAQVPTFRQSGFFTPEVTCAPINLCAGSLDLTEPEGQFSYYDFEGPFDLHTHHTYDPDMDCTFHLDPYSLRKRFTGSEAIVLDCIADLGSGDYLEVFTDSEETVGGWEHEDWWDYFNDTFNMYYTRIILGTDVYVQFSSDNDGVQGHGFHCRYYTVDVSSPWDFCDSVWSHQEDMPELGCQVASGYDGDVSFGEEGGYDSETRMWWLLFDTEYSRYFMEYTFRQFSLGSDDDTSFGTVLDTLSYLDNYGLQYSSPAYSEPFDYRYLSQAFYPTGAPRTGLPFTDWVYDDVEWAMLLLTTTSHSEGRGLDFHFESKYYEDSASCYFADWRNENGGCDDECIEWCVCSHAQGSFGDWYCCEQEWNDWCVIEAQLCYATHDCEPIGLPGNDYTYEQEVRRSANHQRSFRMEPSPAAKEAVRARLQQRAERGGKEGDLRVSAQRWLSTQREAAGLKRTLKARGVTEERLPGLPKRPGQQEGRK